MQEPMAMPLKNDGVVHLCDETVWFDEKDNVYILDGNFDEAYFFKDYNLEIESYEQSIDEESSFITTSVKYIDNNGNLHFLEEIEKDVVLIKTIDTNSFLRNLIGDVSYDELNNYCKAHNRVLCDLCRLPLSKLRKKDTPLFNDVLFEKMFELLEANSISSSEKDLIKKQLISLKESGKIFRLLYTLLYTLRTFENDKKEYDYLDLTFITVSAFKAVEIVFDELLKRHFGFLSIKDTKGNVISFSDPKLTLGNMQQFFLSDDNGIISFLSNNKERVSITKKILKKWIKDSRNGFLHKDIINVNDRQQLRESIVDSILLLANIILIFEK